MIHRLNFRVKLIILLRTPLIDRINQYHKRENVKYRWTYKSINKIKVLSKLLINLKYIRTK